MGNTEYRMIALNQEYLAERNRRSSLGSWFEAVRAGAIGAGIEAPSQDTEGWRYTNPELFAWNVFDNGGVEQVDCVVSRYGALGDASQGGLPVGVVIRRDETLTADDKQVVQEVLAKKSRSGLEWTEGLQVATTASVTVLRVEKGRVIQEPLSIERISRGVGSGTSSVLVVVVEEQASITLVEDVRRDAAALVMTRVEVVVKKHGKIQFLSSQQLPLTSQFVGRYGFSLAERSAARIFCLGLGAQLSRIDLDCRLEGAGAEADIGALSVLRDDQHHDFRPIQQHDAPGCRSDLLAKNVVLERSRAVYYGLIKVGEEAQKTDAYQTNRNLILSPQASVDSIPNLEIAANDVKCSHGSSTGQLGEDDLFYMAARGIPRHLAELLLVDGFAGDVLNRVVDDTVRQSFSKSVEERITGEA